MKNVKEAPIKQQLDIAAKEKKNAIEILREETEKQDLIESIHLEEVKMPKTEDAIEYSKTALAVLAEDAEKMDELVSKAKKVKASLDAFRDVERACERILYHTRLLAEAGDYGEASRTIVELHDYLDMDYGFDTKYKSLLAEILAWTLVKLTIADQNDRAKYRKESLPLEVLLALKEDAKALPLNFHDQEEKDRVIEKAFGLVGSYYLFFGNVDSIVGLGDRFVEISEYGRLENEHSPEVERIFSLLREGSVKAYDRFSRELDDVHAAYEDALLLFRLRSNLTEEEIALPLFKEPKDEHEFRLRYLQNICNHQEGEEFARHASELEKSVINDEREAIELVANLYVDCELSEEKRKYLNRLFTNVSFERMVEILAAMLALGAPEEVFTPLYEAMEKSKKKAIDLEARAEDLLSLREEAPESLKKSVERLLSSLLRSPHARRVIEKSANPSLTKLLSPKAKFRAPMGKKEKKTTVKKWSKWALASFHAFVCILPIVLAILAGGYLYFNYRDSQYFPYLLAVPVFVIALVGTILTIAYAGRDERASAMVRRFYGFLGLLSALAALAYYLCPKDLAVLEPYSYTLLISGGIFLAFGQIAFSDYKKRWNYIIFLPLLLCEIAALVLLVLRAMGK